MGKLLSPVIATLVAVTVAGAAPARPELAYTAGMVKPRVWLADADGTHAHPLVHGAEPLVSPNGEFIAVSPLGGRGSRLVIYSPGSEAHDYLGGRVISATALAWSPDSRYLAVDTLSIAAHPVRKLSGLAVIDARTGAMKMIAEGSACGVSFAPRPPDRLVYGSAPMPDGCFGSHVNLYEVAVRESAVRALTRDGVSLNPVWGAHWIAFDREKPRKLAAPEYEVWVMDADGTHRRQLTHMRVSPMAEGLIPLGFSADGDRLLLAYKGEDASEAWTIQFPAGVAKQLTVGGQSVMPSAISRDGRSVLVTAGGFLGPPTRQTIELVPFGGGRARVLVRDAEEPSWNR